MSEENVAAVRSMYAAFSELARGGDCGAYITAHWDPDGEYRAVEETASGAVPGAGGLFLGPEGVKRFVSWLWEEVDRPHAEIHELIEEGDHVVVSAVIRARGKQSGWRRAGTHGSSGRFETASSCADRASRAGRGRSRRSGYARRRPSA